MDLEALGTLAAAFIALLAFAHSLLQGRRTDRERERADRMRFLLGEKETVAFQAGRIAEDPGTDIPTEMIQALVLAALFENSDRARLQVYRALDSLQGHQRTVVTVALEADIQAAQRYHDGLDLGSFSTRIGQLHAAVPWTISAQPRSEPA